VIEGPRVQLRGWMEADLPALTTWRNDLALQSQLLARVRGSNLDQVRQWAQDRASGQNSLMWVVAMRVDDRAIGYVQLAGLDDLDQCGDIGICLEPNSQGAGIGREVLSLLMSHVPRLRPFRKFELRVRADNARAIRCYESVGFTHCGVLHERTFVGGEFVDVVLMERFLVKR
jgi:diamine N-acetyltransferase